MTKNNVLEFAGREAISDLLTALLRSGAQQLINQAVEAELQELLSQHSGRRTEDGHAVVVRSGHLPERELQTGLGPVTVKIPKVRSRTGDPVTFRSALVPPYVRKTRSLEPSRRNGSEVHAYHSRILDGFSCGPYDHAVALGVLPRPCALRHLWWGGAPSITRPCPGSATPQWLARPLSPPLNPWWEPSLPGEAF